MRVISCHHFELVDYEAGMRYAALSYVWGADPGTPESETRRTRNELPGILPQVVIDAAQVATGLGLSYLWVDKYCIDQNDKAHQKWQIERMDLMYENADITIIDAVGADASHELTGVSSRAEVHIAREIVWRSEKLRAVKCSPILEIAASPWAHRGWTYQ